MALRLEYIVCPNCGSDDYKLVTSRVDTLQVVTCNSCSLSYINPRPSIDQIYKMYEKDYYSGDIEKSIGYSNSMPYPLQLKTFPPYGWELLTENIDPRCKKTIDIGCGCGQWVYWMKKAGAQAIGIDLTADGVKWGKKKLGVDLRQMPVELLNEPEESFDIITIIDVIEHIVDLTAFMSKIARLLKQGGILFIQTPNFECYQKYQENCMFLRYSLEHLVYFNCDALDSVVAKYGLLPIKKTHVYHTIPGDAAAYAKLRQKSSGKLKKFIKTLPFSQLANCLISMMRKKRTLYKIDGDRKEGAAILGIYKKA